MTWFRIDDGFAQHPKVLGIPRKDRAAAIGLWTLAGVWCSSNLTDGRVPAYLPAEVGCPERLARLLVEAGLWRAVDGGGWVFHEWETYQWTREKLDAERERKAAAGRAGGVASGQTRRSRSEAGASAERKQVLRGSLAAASGTAEPQSIPVQSIGTSVVVSPHQSDARVDGPTDDDLEAWTTNPPAGVDLTVERRRFREHNAGAWDTLRDPRKAWLGWLQSASRRQTAADRPTPVPERPHCPLHPDQPTGSQQCPTCAAEAAPAPDLRALRATTTTLEVPA